MFKPDYGVGNNFGVPLGRKNVWQVGRIDETLQTQGLGMCRANVCVQDTFTVCTDRHLHVLSFAAFYEYHDHTKFGFRGISLCSVSSFKCLLSQI